MTKKSKRDNMMSDAKATNFIQLKTKEQLSAQDRIIKTNEENEMVNKEIKRIAIAKQKEFDNKKKINHELMHDLGNAIQTHQYQKLYEKQ